MAVVQAVLTYRPCALNSGTAAPIPLGKTDDPGILRALRDRLIEAAAADYRMWEGVDPGVAAMQRAELERLLRVLSVLLPDEDLKPALRLLEQGHDEGT